ncbi:MAG: DUF2782 domain-containing protein, partial [Rhodanobacter sp.]
GRELHQPLQADILAWADRGASRGRAGALVCFAHPTEVATMKITVLLVATGLGLSLIPVVSVAAPQVQPPGAALPPPGLHDPGVDAAAPQASATTRSPMSPPAVSLPSMQDAGGASPADDETSPEVTMHERGDDSVQEYRRGGQVYMVVVTPKHGIPYTYMLDPQGRWVDEHGQKPAQPVMYKILEWGKSKPAVARSGG